ncbi:hypothetical protein AB0G15_05440 [Streptosporangium sp. NPDC023825]|uniref:hypothetical protein n=1 Tax=Streptosporangium sp. NPDC023825 TaxID=3154909 RepID=UPI0034405B05
MDTPAIAAPDTVSLVVAGGAPITSELFTDLMDDWTRFDTDKPVDVALYLPAAEGTYSPVVDSARYWSTLEGGPGYGIVTVGGRADRRATGHIRAMIDAPGTERTCLVTAEETGASVAETLIMMLIEDNKEQQRTPYLILAWGAEKDAPDDFTWELRAQADQAGIPVLEISATGLQEMPPMEPDVPEEAGGEITEDGHIQLPLPEPDEAQAETPPPPAVSEEVWDLAETLLRSAMYWEHREAAFMAVNEFPGDPQMKLTRSLRHHYEAVSKGSEPVAETPRVEVTVVDPEPAPEPEKAVPAKRGRSRTPADKIAVFVSAKGVEDLAAGFQPQPGDIKLAAGRPRAGWVRQQLDRDQVPGSLLAV